MVCGKMIFKNYLEEKTCSQALHSEYYTRNPNLLKLEVIKDLNFKYHVVFKKADIEER